LTGEQAAAFVTAQAAACYGRIAGMQAENQVRAHKGEAPAYDEQAFANAVAEYTVEHNSVIHLFNTWVDT
jgi:hypothetical protein